MILNSQLTLNEGVTKVSSGIEKYGKSYLAEQFRQIKRSVAEHYSNINFNLARALEDKGSFIRHTHQIRCVALVIVVCTIQLGCAQSRSSGI